MADINPDHQMAVASLVGNYRQRSLKRMLLLLAAVSTLFLMTVMDIMTGPASLSFGDVVSVILNPAGATPQQKSYHLGSTHARCVDGDLHWRNARVAGAEMQTILNNPLADPFTLGLSSAASFGAALAIVLQWSLIPGAGVFFVTGNAFAMAMLTSLALFGFTRLRGGDA